MEKIKCKTCNKIFFDYFSNNKKFCSRKCFEIDHKDGEIKKCLICGKKIYIHRKRLNRFKFCSVICKNKYYSGKRNNKYGTNQSGRNSNSWKGGEFVSEDGYSMVLLVGSGKYTTKQRMILENFLGRKLKSYEIVHHINEDKLDNRIENLQIMTRAEHIRHHLGN